MTYAYFFSEIRKPRCSTPDYDVVLSVPVDPAATSSRLLAAGLRPWVLEVLSSDTLYDIGLYVGEFGTVDEDGMPADVLATSLVAWDGHAELTSASH